MLVIRMQRTGRKGHAMFRLVVQDARRTPTSGKIVAYIGSYDPHAKQVSLDHQKAEYYLEHGAQPSPRVASILKAEKVKLPSWVAAPKVKSRAVRNPDKRRSTAPAAAVEEEKTAAPAEAATEEATTVEAPVEPTADSETAPTPSETQAA